MLSFLMYIKQQYKVSAVKLTIHSSSFDIQCTELTLITLLRKMSISLRKFFSSARPERLNVKRGGVAHKTTLALQHSLKCLYHACQESERSCKCIHCALMVSILLMFLQFSIIFRNCSYRVVFFVFVFYLCMIECLTE